jgi:hypothetical protein
MSVKQGGEVRLTVNMSRGRVAAAVIGAGRKPSGQLADLMIASIAIAEGLPLFTTNPKDFSGLERLLTTSGYQPRSRHSDRWGRWSPRVESSPWPG